MNEYENLRFRQRLDKALEATKLALDAGKMVKPQSAAHQYDDKYAIAECVTRLAYESSLRFCELLGLDADAAARVRDSKGPGKVSFALDVEASATPLRTREKAIEGPSVTVERERESSGSLWGTSKSKAATTTKVTTKVTEHLWTRAWRVRLRAFRGTDLVATLLDCGLEGVEATRTKDAPGSWTRQGAAPVVLAEADWLAALPRGAVAFAIDRGTAKTPRRNDDVDEALARLRALARFARDAKRMVPDATGRAAVEKTLGGARASVFQPAACCALVEAGDETTAPTAQEPALMNHCGATLDRAAASMVEAARGAGEQARAADAEAPGLGLDARLARAWLGLFLLEDAASDLEGAVDHLEHLLYAQLRDAVGKTLTPADFDQYMRAHERRLYKPAFRPRPMTHAIRRTPTAFPEGSVSLEDGDRKPVFCLSRRVDALEGSTIRVPVGAATVLECRGEARGRAEAAASSTGSLGAGSARVEGRP